MIIPTMLLSMGMLFFFTLASSMVGDICDEDDLKTGHRSEGSYYSVFWWFIKLGTAGASIVTGLLIVFTQFDEKQKTTVDAFIAPIDSLYSQVQVWSDSVPEPNGYEKFVNNIKDEFVEIVESVVGSDVFDSDEIPQTDLHSKIVNDTFDKILEESSKVRQQLEKRFVDYPDETEHNNLLLETLDAVFFKVQELNKDVSVLKFNSKEFYDKIVKLRNTALPLKHQTPKTLFLMRVVEIGLPLLLSLFSIYFLMKYPLSESRCYEIKQALKNRELAK